MEAGGLSAPGQGLGQQASGLGDADGDEAVEVGEGGLPNDPGDGTGGVFTEGPEVLNYPMVSS
ncbi:MAG: hypothetical protein M3P97_10290 [Actinomycetota bacterium]|jgi:hypothetical protein|nr:hypothetical protein [Actinomycetota bacterium]